jgi:hypothetical protein
LVGRVARLGVKAMSLYNHVEGKDGLLDGLVELPWRNLAEVEVTADWRRRPHDLARAIRSTVARHASAATATARGRSSSAPISCCGP